MEDEEPGAGRREMGAAGLRDVRFRPKVAGFPQSCGPALISDIPSRPDQSTTT